MRLIDADRLKELLHEYCIDNDPYCQQIYDFLGIDDAIDNAPTVVPEDFMDPYEEGYERARKDFERPTGKWIEHDFKTCGGLGDWDYKCSNCEKVYCGKSNYCPNCGAKMKGAEE